MRPCFPACLALLSSVWIGCGEAGNDLFQGGACRPGEPQPCECAGGVQGWSECLADGTGLGECLCPDASLADGAAGSAGKDAQPETSSNGGSAGADAGPDGAGGKDGGAGAVAILGDPCSDKGKLACAGHAQKLQLLCDGTKWISNGTCAGMQVCDPREGPTAGSCQDPIAGCAGKAPGATFCQGPVRNICGPDLLTVSTVACPSEALCQAGSGDQCALCLAGQHMCDDANLLSCAVDHLAWTFEKACPSEALCDAANAVCGQAQCSPTQHRCAGDTLEKCSADLTGFVPVQNCLAGLCDAPGKQCDVCLAGSKTCLDDKQVRTCAADGQSQSLSPCPAATPYCSGQGQCGTCAVTEILAGAAPVDMFFMLDTSGSMTGANMTLLQQGLLAFTSDPLAAGVFVAAEQFPIQTNGVPSCNVADYSSPAINWGMLGYPAFNAWVGGLIADGLTPSVPALQGAVQACIARMASAPGRSCSVLFITDGEPTECDPNGAKPTLGSTAALAWSKGIRVHAIGFPNLSSIGLDLLNYIAQQGGTSTPVMAYTSSDLTNAIRNAQTAAVDCSFAKPQTMGDPSKSQVSFIGSKGAPPIGLPNVGGASGCSGDGWYLDPQSAEPLIVCPATCARFQGDALAKLRIKSCP